MLSTRKSKGELREMSEKPTKAKEKSAKAKEKPAEAKEQAAKAKGKSAKAKGKSAKAKEKSAEAKEQPAKAKEKPAEAKEKPAEAKEKPAEAKEQPAKAKEKPLEKMTVKELREMAKEMPGINGVHGMKKEDLVVAINKTKGIKAAPVKKADTAVAGLKKRIRALKVERQTALEARDKKMATIYKRRISRLKKKTRRAAA
jgi:hypothetical protein